jgi:hypothetical protein
LEYQDSRAAWPAVNREIKLFCSPPFGPLFLPFYQPNQPFQPIYLGGLACLSGGL